MLLCHSFNLVLLTVYNFSDEVGFVHPSQFSTLKEASGGSTSSQDISEHENTNFWIRDHKLGISTQVLLPLYQAAKHAFMAALREYKTSENLPGNSGDDSLESEVMSHSKALLMLSCDFGTAWNSRFFPLAYLTREIVLWHVLYIVMFTLLLVFIVTPSCTLCHIGSLFC